VEPRGLQERFWYLSPPAWILVPPVLLK
jgi:hypothetical protein